MLDKYTTIETKVDAEIVEKKSKFIANVFPIENEKEALTLLEEVRKQHRDARHNVFVYRIANGNERASDDGEPSGTAGVPILDILRGMNLQNVLVVVTRYFGGILLGTGGLVRAYTGAFQEALQNVEIIEKEVGKYVKVITNYQDLEKFKYYLKQKDVEIIKIEYTENVDVYIDITDEKLKELKETLNDLNFKIFNIEEIENKYIIKKD